MWFLLGMAWGLLLRSSWRWLREAQEKPDIIAALVYFTLVLAGAIFILIVSIIHPITI